MVANRKRGKQKKINGFKEIAMEVGNESSDYHVNADQLANGH